MVDLYISATTFELSYILVSRLRGATVARLTPDQKVACSNHVGVKDGIFKARQQQIHA